jgi:hypothetical protein
MHGTQLTRYRFPKLGDIVLFERGTLTTERINQFQKLLLVEP